MSSKSLFVPRNTSVVTTSLTDRAKLTDWLIKNFKRIFLETYFFNSCRFTHSNCSSYRCLDLCKLKRAFLDGGKTLKKLTFWIILKILKMKIYFQKLILNFKHSPFCEILIYLISLWFLFQLIKYISRNFVKSLYETIIKCNHVERV